MKSITTFILGLIVGMVMIGGATMAFAQDGGSGSRPEGRPPCGPGQPGGHGPAGVVTAIGDDSLSLEGRDDEAITVNTSEDTIVRLIESRSEGSLSDIDVGDNVKVHGPRNDDDSIDARDIIVEPDGDKVGGRVTDVSGGTITVENRDGKATLVTSDSTRFDLRPDETGSLADVSEGKGVLAFGQTQEDGSLNATIVLIHDGPRPGGPRKGGPDGRPAPDGQ